MKVLLLRLALVTGGLLCSYGLTLYLTKELRIEAAGVVGFFVWVFSLLLVSFLLFVLRRIVLLLWERRCAVPGSRIRMRFSLLFIAVGLLPVLLFSAFMYSLFMSGMTALYNPEIENALDLSVQFVQESRDSIQNEFIAFVHRYFNSRAGIFDERGKKSGLLHFEQIGRYSLERPYLPPMLRRRLAVSPETREVFSEPHRDTVYLVYYNIQGRFVEYASLELNPTLYMGAERISLALTEYRQLRLMRQPLELALFYLVVFFAAVVTFVSLLLAMRFARIVTEPVRMLVEGTRRIAHGELGYRVSAIGVDEFGQLMDNFNSMSNELAQSKQKLYRAERFAAWQEVAQRLAHEIKNPLTPIQLGAERILRQSRKESESLHQICEKVLPAIINEVKVIEDLINEFASFARLPEKHVMPVNVEKFLEETVEPLRALHEGIRFILTVGSIGEKLFDREQMKRAIINLLQNAINAITKTARPGILQITAEKTDEGVRFIIRDNGCGIPPEVGDEVFAPYFSRHEGGTGLGLPIVEKIVHDHGGRVWFESSPEGTSFYVTLSCTK
jgi:nitrogen fixation/metabolism regulation signal transduction histidine kinase